MLKRKKVLILTVVVLLMVAMATTAYAAMNSCYLSLGETGWESTSSLTTVNAKTTGYNSQYSTGNMTIKMQYYYGSWHAVTSASVAPNTWGVSSGWQTVNQSVPWRTKIYSAVGNVEGGGYIHSN